MWYIPIVSPRIMRILGYIMAGTRNARGAAIFPFIIFRSKNEMVPWVINHECIHFKQQVETLFVGIKIVWIIETFYGILILRKNWNDLYVWRSSEQEAYRNQNDANYLVTRKPFAWIWYMFHKRTFTITGPGEITYTD